MSVWIWTSLAVLLALWAVGLYNRLVRLKNVVKEAWSGIDVQLRRRHNLIPNLVKTVERYASHEKTTLEQVTGLRAKSMGAQGMGERGELESRLGMSLANILAVAENYPQLKADSNFRELQAELSGLEEQIQLARRYYNGTARDYNVQVESFPSNLVARAFGFTTVEYFELDDPAARQVPDVNFH
ncbi:MAG: LemA family protein [Deltaproteobacteria bacterium]|nr:LemA family protein [Deltaproteobacteria bacterium]